MAHISLTLVGLMWVLPFLYYYHAYPLTTFYQEWGAAILGLGASALLLSRHYWMQPEVPRIVLLPVGLLLLALLQYLLGKTIYFDQTLLFTLYMLWITLLMMLGRALRVQLGFAALFVPLAGFILLGAELNALSGILQHYRWHTFLDTVITSKNGIAVYGNMAQPNHFANYIALGLVSLGLLRIHLRHWQTVLLALPLLFVLVLSGSRSSWLYLLGLVVISFVWQHKDRSYRSLLYYFLLLLLGFGVMHWVAQLAQLSGATGSVTALQRMASGDTSHSVRLYLWNEAWIIFTQFPWLGAGFGQFAWQHFQLGPVLQATNITGLYNNAHNVLMQLAAEMGLAGVLVLLGALAMWARQAWKAGLGASRWWGYAMLFVIGVHSLLEYPLWYAYFLGVVAVLLGALDEGVYRLELRRMGRLSIALILLLGLVSLAQLQLGYRRLERVVAMRPVSADDNAFVQTVRDELVQIHNMPMLMPYAELFMQNMMDLNSEDIEQKLAFNERSVKFIPVGNWVYRRAILLAFADRPAEACTQIGQAIWSYPSDFPAQQKELSALAVKDSKRFAALLEFANKKYEEYQHALSAK